MNTSSSLPTPNHLSATDILGMLTKNGRPTIIFTSYDLHIGYANEAILSLWNKKAIEAGSTLVTVAPELVNLIANLRQVWDEGKPMNVINAYTTIDFNGVLVEAPFDFDHRPIKNAAGETIAIITSAVKVEERAMVDENLRRIADEERDLISNLTKLNKELELNKMQLTNALQAASLGSYDLDLLTGQMSCSNQCKLNFGRLIDRDFDYSDLLECILPQHHDAFTESISLALLNKQSFNIEYQIKWQDDSIHWIQSNGTPQYDDNGVATRIIGVTQEITEKKNYQSKKDEFLSVASHELKTPITVLKASIQMLQRLKPKIENQLAVKLIESCDTGIEKVQSLLNEYLDAGRYADGKIGLNISVFDVNELLSESIAHLDKKDRSKLTVLGLPNQLSGDKSRLEQVLINFVNNAYKYAPQSTEIIMSATIDENFVEFSVRDFGPGLTEDEAQHIFDRYWQANTKQNNSKGLGLGLYICSEIIRKHNGSIGVESTLGRGAKFWFRIPIA
ncbi:ATP-binding protein [Sphingobacterium oryzagri]|uniref:histidine kinase n=1 Tax=Sphingobacterium oryzagri TaxID=3025669 RepID=A0ABY7WFM2_9SPHI|nr:ATP-binding protein [Sphingobacterium sp. KACC 22765]WDF67075.1 ATP-binding protein [Sphingobacterium sp. KACC 22765]